MFNNGPPVLPLIKAKINKQKNEKRLIKKNAP